MKPAIAFCSWMSSGRRVSQAATPPGSGDEPAEADHQRRLAAPHDRAAPAAARRVSRSGAASQRAASPCRASRRPTATRCAMPSAGTSRASSPRARAEPDDLAGAARAAARASASAGNTCPPVPPAMMRTGGAPVSFRDSVARRAATVAEPRRSQHRLVVDAQQQSQPGQRHDQARAAVAHERQRQSLGRQHAHVDADVDERLDAEPQAEAGGEVALELQARLARRGARCTKARQTSARNSAERQQHADQARAPRRAPRTGSRCAPRAGRTASARCRRGRRRTMSPRPIAISDCVSWKPLLKGSAQGSRKAVRRRMR